MAGLIPVYFGDPAEATRALAPLLTLAPPALDLTGRCPIRKRSS